MTSWIARNVPSRSGGLCRSNTSDMIFTAATLIRHPSQFMVLSPGDVINTGTPQGVALSGRFPYLRAGDYMELEIGGLGRQRQELTTAQA
jgi:2,4-diketo-3-deoxy-L-fuconate hydrolase